MAKRSQNHETRQRGIFERPAGSGIWWIHWYDGEGRRHREKVGTKGAAINLYKIRKAAVLEGRKLPTLKRSRSRITLSDLIDLMLEHVRSRASKDQRSYSSRGEILRAALGSRPAEELTPQEIERWLAKQCRSAATHNRYRALISLCYRQGIRNNQLSVNPARLVVHRKEEQNRIRFLSREEYQRLHGVIARRFPEHLAEFVFSVHTGMRLSEQYRIQWRYVDLDRRVIDLTRTKNSVPRLVHLNSEALAAVRSARPKGPVRSSDRVFSHEGPAFDNRPWFTPCLKEAKIEDYSWHTNRHTFCSWLAMAGASTREIMEAAGHRTLAMAAQYAHLSPSHTQSLVERIITDGKTNSHQNSHQHEISG